MLCTDDVGAARLSAAESGSPPEATPRGASHGLFVTCHAPSATSLSASAFTGGGGGGGAVDVRLRGRRTQTNKEESAAGCDDGATFVREVKHAPASGMPRPPVGLSWYSAGRFGRSESWSCHR